MKHQAHVELNSKNTVTVRSLLELAQHMLGEDLTEVDLSFHYFLHERKVVDYLPNILEHKADYYFNLVDVLPEGYELRKIMTFDTDEINIVLCYTAGGRFGAATRYLLVDFNEDVYATLTEFANTANLANAKAGFIQLN